MPAAGTDLSGRRRRLLRDQIVEHRGRRAAPPPRASARPRRECVVDRAGAPRGGGGELPLVRARHPATAHRPAVWWRRAACLRAGGERLQFPRAGPRAVGAAHKDRGGSDDHIVPASPPPPPPRTRHGEAVPRRASPRLGCRHVVHEREVRGVDAEERAPPPPPASLAPPPPSSRRSAPPRLRRAACLPAASRRRAPQPRKRRAAAPRERAPPARGELVDRLSRLERRAAGLPTAHGRASPPPTAAPRARSRTRRARRRARPPRCAPRRARPPLRRGGRQAHRRPAARRRSAPPAATRRPLRPAAGRPSSVAPPRRPRRRGRRRIVRLVLREQRHELVVHARARACCFRAAPAPPQRAPPPPPALLLLLTIAERHLAARRCCTAGTYSATSTVGEKWRAPSPARRRFSAADIRYACGFGSISSRFCVCVVRSVATVSPIHVVPAAMCCVGSRCGARSDCGSGLTGRGVARDLARSARLPMSTVVFTLNFSRPRRRRGSRILNSPYNRGHGAHSLHSFRASRAA